VLIAAGVLLQASNLDRSDPSTGSLYVALAVLTFLVPIWLIYTVFAWSWHGATVGMALARVRVVGLDGRPPGVWRAVLRAVVLFLLTFPALVAPLALAVAISLGSAGPPAVWAPIIAAVAGSTTVCVSPLFSPGHRWWHDKICRTSVVTAAETRLDSTWQFPA
jgi:uncharacterized RDD family membrane protein YckC